MDIPPFLVLAVNGRQYGVAYELLAPAEQREMAALLAEIGSDPVDATAAVLWLLVRRDDPSATFDEIAEAVQVMISGHLQAASA